MEYPPLPPELCRFRSFASPYKNGKDEEAVYELLSGRLRFSDVTSFNDPFEAKPRYVAAFADAGRQRQAMLEYLTEIAPACESRTQRRRWAEAALRGKSMDEVVRFAEQRNRNRSGQFYVLCLMAPETVSTPLPWAHYADGHMGVCIHLDTATRPLPLAFPIEYTVEYPSLVVPRTHRDPMDLMRNLVLRKANAWSYEQEYRVVRLNLPESPPISRTLLVDWDGNVAIAAATVARAITLGCRMEETTRRRLIDWIAKNAPHVQVWQADLHRSRYEIVRERIA